MQRREFETTSDHAEAWLHAGSPKSPHLYEGEPSSEFDQELLRQQNELVHRGELFAEFALNGGKSKVQVFPLPIDEYNFETRENETTFLAVTPDGPRGIKLKKTEKAKKLNLTSQQVDVAGSEISRKIKNSVSYLLARKHEHEAVKFRQNDDSDVILSITLGSSFSLGGPSLFKTELSPISDEKAGQIYFENKKKLAEKHLKQRK